MTGPGTLWAESLEEQFTQVRETEVCVCLKIIIIIRYLYIMKVSFISNIFIL